MEIIKRDGRIEPYQSEKIKAAVAAAFQSIKTEIDETVLRKMYSSNWFSCSSNMSLYK